MSLCLSANGFESLMKTVSLKRRWIRVEHVQPSIKGVSWPTQHPLVATVIVRAKQGQILEVTVKCYQRPSSWWGAACKSWFRVKWLRIEHTNILGVWVRELEIQMWNELLATDFLKIFWIQNQETNNTLNTERFEIQARIFWNVISFFSSRCNK